MTDEQLKSILGVEETMQMLQFRESIKSQMTPELWEQNMNTHKTSINMLRGHRPHLSPVEAATEIVLALDADKKLDPDEREMWKALVVVAAFEMQEFD
ncbi:hypothetical protein IC229_05655 [Spirosoma sp. BT702]|uniref:Uncharacterized protein n=1 Tax=Spirosoma profusum TaxID=2771354 RepID=A0A927ARR0_9BACT|nr:hypothetical protein [Spirosoma profusum]MBD2700110.1 hypothetical protein [Spirosoma profusum]